MARKQFHGVLKLRFSAPPEAKQGGIGCTAEGCRGAAPKLLCAGKLILASVTKILPQNAYLDGDCPSSRLPFIFCSSSRLSSLPARRRTFPSNITTLWSSGFVSQIFSIILNPRLFSISKKIIFQTNVKNEKGTNLRGTLTSFLVKFVIQNYQWIRKTAGLHQTY